MKKAWGALRVIFTGLLLLILTANLYFIGARHIFHVPCPKWFGYCSSIVLSGSMEPTFSAGDFLIYRAQDSYAAGDIIIFSESGNYITHRIVGETEDGFVTKGDANNAPDPHMLRPDNIEGRMVMVIPRLGSFILFLRTPPGIFGLILLGLLFWEAPRIRRTFQRKKGKA